MVRQDLSEGQAIANLLSSTAVSHHISMQEVCPLHALPNVERRIAQERLWPSEDDQTFPQDISYSHMHLTVCEEACVISCTLYLIPTVTPHAVHMPPLHNYIKTLCTAT